MALNEIVTFIYDNYVLTLPSPRPVLTLVGVGEAYLALKLLLLSRPDSRHHIAACLAFVNGTLRPVKSETDGGLSKWWREHSCIFVGKDHACWVDEESAKKVRKVRFGKVVMSDVAGGEVGGLARMVISETEPGCAFLQDALETWNSDAEVDEDDYAMA